MATRATRTAPRTIRGGGGGRKTRCVRTSEEDGACARDCLAGPRAGASPRVAPPSLAGCMECALRGGGREIAARRVAITRKSGAEARAHPNSQTLGKTWQPRTISGGVSRDRDLTDRLQCQMRPPYSVKTLKMCNSRCNKPRQAKVECGSKKSNAPPSPTASKVALAQSLAPSRRRDYQ